MGPVGSRSAKDQPGRLTSDAERSRSVTQMSGMPSASPGVEWTFLPISGRKVWLGGPGQSSAGREGIVVSNTGPHMLKTQ